MDVHKHEKLQARTGLYAGVTVAYSGVHQAFQLALAAQEAGMLQEFLCSLYDAPGKWGWLSAGCLGRARMASRSLLGLDSTRTVEHPWPLLRKVLQDKLMPTCTVGWLSVNDAFDRWAARRFKSRPSRVFVGTETCAMHGFEAARTAGVITVLDCPQLHPALLAEVMAEAGERARLPGVVEHEELQMAKRKRREYELADWRLVYSGMHRRSFELAGFDPTRQVEIPLWVDPRLWFPEREKRGRPAKLSVLFVGSITLRKGIPFLLEAFDLGGGAWDLTLVGHVDSALRERFAPYEGRVRLLPPQPKAQLRCLYAEHDLFVLPSVADSFGFVALEAMACGTPVLVSENCGAPVPDPSWRVRAMDAQDLAEKIMAYVLQPERVLEQGARGREFAAQFTPERYREQAGAFFKRLMAGS